MTFLENYDSLLKAFWYIALPVSLFFAIQTVATFMGFGGADTDTDFETQTSDSDLPFELFTLRNLINFLLGFSWGGISLYNLIGNKAILILVAVLIGIFFVAVFFFIIKQLLKLSEDNSFTYEKTIDKTGTVYLTIPERKSGTGKIQISIGGSIHELPALTENDKIETGSLVKVIRVENNTLLIVEKI